MVMVMATAEGRTVAKWEMVMVRVACTGGEEATAKLEHERCQERQTMSASLYLTNLPQIVRLTYSIIYGGALNAGREDSSS